MERPANLLFPEFLDQGSTGGAVIMLALLLKAAGLDRADGDLPARPIALDGDYAPNGPIAAAVMRFQRNVGFTGDAVDGNFGPKTREKFTEVYGINVNDLTLTMLIMATEAVSPPSAG